MRQSLLNSFSEINIFNLHGNSNKKEKSPDGSIDEKVFDIQQGVAISFFIKKNANDIKRIQYFDLYGLRELSDKNLYLDGEKYKWLSQNSILSG